MAVDVSTGEVLAMVSRPSFDPSQFSRGISTEYWSSLVQNEKNPLRDRTIQEHYAPGSTFKTTVPKIASKVAERFFCSPGFKVTAC